MSEYEKGTITTVYYWTEYRAQFSLRTANTLLNNDIHVYPELADLKISELLNMKGLGVKGLREILDFIGCQK